MEDKLVVCSHCGSDACYEHKQQGITVLSCLSCGYTTNELMTEGSQLVTEIEEVMPELYKDIKFIDDQKRVWYPTVINIQDKGTVFVNGTDKDTWGWAGIKAVETTDEEKETIVLKSEIEIEKIEQKYEDKYLEKFKRFPNEFQFTELEMEEEKKEFENIKTTTETNRNQTINKIKETVCDKNT